jgi:hypothetical protein
LGRNKVALKKIYYSPGANSAGRGRFAAMQIVQPTQIKPLAASPWTAYQLLEVTPSQLARLIKRGQVAVVCLDGRLT